MRTTTSLLALFLFPTIVLIGPTSTADAAPIIHEVFYDAAGSDSGQVFTELFGEAGVGLDGWTLVGINGGTGLSYRTVDLTGAVFPSDGLLVIAQSTATGILATERDVIGNVDWQNGPDAVQLLDPMSFVIDALQFGDAGTNNAGFGIPALDAPAGSSLSRDLFGTNTGNNLVDFSVTAPTPGVGPTTTPPTSVPEPSTGVLLGLGLCAAVIRRWRQKLSALNALIEAVAHDGPTVMTDRALSPPRGRDA